MTKKVLNLNRLRSTLECVLSDPLCVTPVNLSSIGLNLVILLQFW